MNRTPRLRTILSGVAAIGLAGFAGAPPLAAQNPNLISNAEFHQNVDGWSATAGYSSIAWNSFDWTECGSLSGSALFSNGGPTGNQTAFATVCVPTIEDATIHSFGGELRFPTGQNRTGTATLLTTWLAGADCAGAVLGTTPAGVIVNSAFDAGIWVQVRVDAAYAPAGSGSAQIAVQLVKNEAGGGLDLRLDGFYLVAQPAFVFRDGFGLNSTCRWSSEEL